jgi:mannose-1-phosphate guanylyltransferase/mannose-1-phosphate guanylyltransferase/mannose-6-phosphate isomerase
MITPVILSGGSGTRLWPLSRPEKPKQFLALTGERTMLQMTLARTADRDRFVPPIVIAAQSHAEEIKRQTSMEIACLVLEPAARNTAPAIALAALLVAPDAPLLVMPSDHLIRDKQAFMDAVERGLPLAEQGWLVTFGILPDRAETGYGYIRRGEVIAPGVHRVERFVEKPDAATAEALLASGDHFWNGGIFLVRADAYLAALGAHAPEVLHAARRAMANRTGSDRNIYPDAEAFAAAPSISVDYAVMEKADAVAVVPVNMGWSDIGSWDALYKAGEADTNGNLLTGNAVAVDSRGCLIRSDGPTVVTVGIEDLIVVASGDSILILPRGQSQRMKEAVDALSAFDAESLSAAKRSRPTAVSK